MAKLESAIKETIARGARRQIGAATRPLRREVARLRRTVAELRRAMAALHRRAATWDRAMEGVSPTPAVSEEDAKAARLSPRLILSLRKRLGLSQTALARAVGVSAPAVAHWEAGDASPTGQNRATLVGLRRVGKRAVKDLLARRAKENGARSPAPRKRRSAKRGSKRRSRKVKRSS
jgi:DNA-binding transcriptional regulator YiaG